MAKSFIIRGIGLLFSIAGLALECLASTTEHQEIVEESAEKAAGKVVEHIDQHRKERNKR